MFSLELHLSDAEFNAIRDRCEREHYTCLKVAAEVYGDCPNCALPSNCHDY